MTILLDTSVAILLRDGDPGIMDRIAEARDAIVMSMVTRVELEGGVYRDPAKTAIRRARLDAVLSAIPALPFDAAAADAYARIVAASGYSRRKLLDRMIAAQALVHRARLATRNPADFAEVPGLDCLAW